MVGMGGIGSWTGLALARNGHRLYLVDPDTVDQTNVDGGQLFRKQDIGRFKTDTLADIYKQLGCTAAIDSIPVAYRRELGCSDIVVTGLDDMDPRRLVFEVWKEHVMESRKLGEDKQCLLVDGRLTMEMFEVLAVQGGDQEAIDAYEKEYLFSNEESPDLDCTTKQTTFAAMGIASAMTAAICNFLTNLKIGATFRVIPFYQRMYFPLFLQTLEGAVEAIETTAT